MEEKMYKALINKNQLTITLLTVLLTLGACSKKNATYKNPKGFERITSNLGEAIGEDWFNLDPTTDGIEGVSSDKLFVRLNGTRPAIARTEAVIVAVIDSGVDIHHEDLQGKIWVNEDEIPGNGIDDDNNGYIDDVHGWNYIGGYDADGNVVHINEETLEMTRIFKKYRDRLRAGDTLSFVEQQLFDEVTQKIEDESAYNQNRLDFTNDLLETLESTHDSLAAELQLGFSLEEMTRDSLAAVVTDTDAQAELRDNTVAQWDTYRTEVDRPHFNNVDILHRVKDYDTQVVLYYYNPDFDPRSEIVGDDPTDFNDTHYGNHDVTGPDSDHGTHVAGIIAANRNNDLGIRGIADNVKIMALRAVPNGDERDKDVALAVRYAVDNGASVINMSFGKAYSPFRHKVEEAMQYASDNGVVLVHAAGNDSKDNDVDFSYPIRTRRDGSGDIETWIEVGASSKNRDELMVANFSNFGQTTVDIFAPGHNIESTVPGTDDNPNGEYAIFSGTSMASPAVAGVIALVLEMNSELDGLEAKRLIMNTGRSHHDLEVILPGFHNVTDPQKVLFDKLSITGKVANGFNALRDTLGI